MHGRESREDHLPLMGHGQAVPLANVSETPGCVIALHLNNLYSLIIIIQLSSADPKPGP